MLVTTSILAQAQWRGTACSDGGGTALALRLRGLPSPGQTVDLGLTASPTVTTYTLLVGASDSAWGSVPLPLDLAFAGMPGCTLYASPDLVLAPLAVAAWTSLPLPDVPAVLGRSLHLQAVVHDPAIARPTPVATSDLLTLTLIAPPLVQAEPIHTGPTRVGTPPTWNAHLPKLAGDAVHLYAVHTHYATDVAARTSTILRRPRAGGAWVAVATVAQAQQLPGIVMDTVQRLHLVFNCAASSGDCFPGGAGGHRFYHLIFATRDGSGALRFDTYLNHDEWPQANNGYLGLGTTATGATIWSLADNNWDRIPQWWASGTSFGTFPALSSTGAYLLYPVTAAAPAADQWLLYFGEFVPGSNNALYRASVAYLWDPPASGSRLLFREVHPNPIVGATNAFPSDVAWDEAGVLHVLSYLRDATTCTWLRRYADGVANPPVVRAVGCVSNYATIQFNRRGTLYLLTPGAGSQVRLGVSHDRGASWAWIDVPIQGLPANGDVRYVGYGPVKPFTSPGLYDPDVLRFFFAGLDASDQAQHSYYGELPLPY
ncbi:MAG: hypothetical protein R3F56_13145 [Planctomycetota bacterium]